jgi:RNA polymerase sigma-70 factor (ECF subfamily)
MRSVVMFRKLMVRYRKQVMTVAERSNEEWLQALSSPGPDRKAALKDLRAILLAGLSKALVGWVRTSGREFQALAEDFVQETLVRVLDSLDSFKGLARFTTWAHKIAVRIALTELRRRRWQDVSLDRVFEDETADMLLKDPAPGPAAQAERTLSVEWVLRIVAEELTQKQRQAIVAVMHGGLPAEEAARRLDTNRNALYKLIHDARVRLKRRLEREGVSVDQLLQEVGKR